MFSPGYRLFMGFAGFGFVAAFLYGVVTGDGGGADYLGFIDSEVWVGAASLGWSGGVGDHVGYVTLVMFAIVSSGLAIMLTAFRDADTDAVAELNDGKLPPAQSPVAYNYWPVIGALGLGTLVIGLVTHSAIFTVGLIILITTAFELMMSAWSDRATGDPIANAELRNRLMKPLEVPVLGAVGIAVTVLCASRIFLAVSKSWAIWAAVILSVIVFFGALAFALVEKVNKNVLAGVLATAAIGLLTAGVVSAVVGERDISHHHTGEHSETNIEHHDGEVEHHDGENGEK
jgi:FtsH-binding integral membrane protein